MQVGQTPYKQSCMGNFVRHTATASIEHNVLDKATVLPCITHELWFYKAIWCNTLLCDLVAMDCLLRKRFKVRYPVRIVCKCRPLDELHSLVILLNKIFALLLSFGHFNGLG